MNSQDITSIDDYVKLIVFIDQTIKQSFQKLMKITGDELACGGWFICAEHSEPFVLGVLDYRDKEVFYSTTEGLYTNIPVSGRELSALQDTFFIKKKNLTLEICAPYGERYLSVQTMIESKKEANN